MPSSFVDPLAAVGTTYLMLGFGDWAVPTLALTVPGILLILAVLGQSVAGIVWLPVIRRRLGGFGLVRRWKSAG